MLKGSSSLKEKTGTVAKSNASWRICPLQTKSWKQQTTDHLSVQEAGCLYLSMLHWILRWGWRAQE
jgi:hypothetical protein